MKRKVFNTAVAFLMLITICAAGLPVQKVQAAGNSVQAAKTEGLAEPVVGKLKNTYRGIRVSWSRSDGADYYCIYRKLTVVNTLTNQKSVKDWEKIAETDAEVFVDETVQSASYKDYKYEYKVQAVGTDKSGESILSPISERRQMYRLPRAGIKVAQNSKTMIELRTNNVNAEFDGFIVYRKGPGESSYTKIAKTHISSYIDRDVEEGKTYSYKIRTFRSKSRSTVSKEKVLTCGGK